MVNRPNERFPRSRLVDRAVEDVLGWIGRMSWMSVVVGNG